VCRAHTTKYKIEQKIDSLSLPLKFLNDLMYTECENCFPKEGNLVSSSAVYDAYVAWCRGAKPVRPAVLAKIFEEVKWLSLQRYLSRATA